MRPPTERDEKRLAEDFILAAARKLLDVHGEPPGPFEVRVEQEGRRCAYELRGGAVNAVDRPQTVLVAPSHLLSEDEAELVLQLDATPMSAEALAARAGGSRTRIKLLVAGLKERGAVRPRRGGYQLEADPLFAEAARAVLGRVQS
jgi:biotin operon repressor